MKYNYTIDQVNLFYEKEIKREIDSQKMEAIITANAVAYGSPSWSKDGAREKSRMWRSFIDSLTWEKLEEKQSVDVVKMVKGLGVIPIRENKKKGDK